MAAKFPPDVVCHYLKKIKDAVCYAVTVEYDDPDEIAKEKETEIAILKILENSKLIHLDEFVWNTVEFKSGYLDISLRRKGLEFLNTHSAQRLYDAIDLPSNPQDEVPQDEVIADPDNLNLQFEVIEDAQATTDADLPINGANPDDDGIRGVLQKGNDLTQ